MVDYNVYRRFKKIEVGNTWITNIVVVGVQVFLICFPFLYPDFAVTRWYIWVGCGIYELFGSRFIKNRIKKYKGYDIMPQDKVTRERWTIDGAAVLAMIAGYGFGLLYTILGSAMLIAPAVRSLWNGIVKVG